MYISKWKGSIWFTNIRIDICEAGKFDEAIFALRRNQRGESDFYAFCNEVAKAGVYKWVSDLNEMTCTYFDKTEQVIILESIPSV